jgi:hypothetical protein
MPQHFYTFHFFKFFSIIYFIKKPDPLFADRVYCLQFLQIVLQKFTPRSFYFTFIMVRTTTRLC